MPITWERKPATAEPPPEQATPVAALEAELAGIDALIEAATDEDDILRLVARKTVLPHRIRDARRDNLTAQLDEVQRQLAAADAQWRTVQAKLEEAIDAHGRAEADLNAQRRRFNEADQILENLHRVAGRITGEIDAL